MILRSHVCDCLVLNWALPLDVMPPPPAPLRYEVHSWGGFEWVFASALLFQHRGVHGAQVPWLRISHSQMNIRLYVLDPEGVPSVFFRRMLVPSWVLPGLRIAVGSVARAARLRLPVSRAALEPEARWMVEREGRLDVRTRLGGSASCAGPRLGTFERTVQIFHDRTRGYALGSHGLRVVSAVHPSVEAVPVVAEIDDLSLLERIFEAPMPFPALHSSWICPEFSIEFDLHPLRVEPLPQALPHPAASRAALRFERRRMER